MVRTYGEGATMVPMVRVPMVRVAIVRVPMTRVRAQLLATQGGGVCCEYTRSECTGRRGMSRGAMGSHRCRKRSRGLQSGWDDRVDGMTE